MGVGEGKRSVEVRAEIIKHLTRFSWPELDYMHTKQIQQLAK